MSKVKVSEEDFRAYEEVRKGGAFNMMSSNAQMMTGLGQPVYRAIMSQYDALSKKYPKVVA